MVTRRNEGDDSMTGNSTPYRLHGVSASEGAAVAPSFLYRRPPLPVEADSASGPDAELRRISKALEAARAQLRDVQHGISGTADDETARIFEFHRAVLEDPTLIQAIEGLVCAKAHTAEAAVRSTFSNWLARFESMDSERMRLRAVDLRDVRDRLLAVLLGAGQTQLREMPGPVIVVAEDLMPSEIATMDGNQVLGLCTARGGSTSHVAIIARSKGIPAVVGLGQCILAIKPGTVLAVDGTAGVVEIGPSPTTIQAFRSRRQTISAARSVAVARASEAAITRDGHRVRILANIGDVASAREAEACGAEGVGLLRTEFLYLNRESPPTEDEQLAAYRAIAEALGRGVLVVRTLDIGGDKRVPFLSGQGEPNPLLGLRGIRLCLRRSDIFLPQLRAIVRAAADHRVSVLLPMVATREEIVEARGALVQVQQDLEATGVPHPAHVELGIMVETPAVAIIAGAIASQVDFFSIGSNDLTQYTLACDRSNESVTHLCSALHPAVLHQIRCVVDAGHAAGKRVNLCGELAASPRGIPLLLGLGLDELSMSPRAIPAAKQLLRKLERHRAQDLAGEVLSFGSAHEVRVRVDQFLEVLS